ncbi:hypothetical protein MARI_33320 [Marinobacter sp. JH2]|nr:hypothetical protein MARI_33320 [Marinobacter sp. JH2]
MQTAPVSIDESVKMQVAQSIRLFSELVVIANWFINVGVRLCCHKGVSCV